MPDVKRMISEVAAENGIRVEPGDPLFALVTMNRLVLEEAAQRFYDHNQKLIAEFHESMKKAETRAGQVLAQMVKESAEKMREGLQGDIRSAGLKAREYVHLVNEAHRRPAIIRWAAVGLVAGAALFAAGVWFAPCLH
ncbi:MAG: hypothetical protein WBE37_33840 [Bryobacteraceae bacterium]